MTQQGYQHMQPVFEMLYLSHLHQVGKIGAKRGTSPLVENKLFSMNTYLQFEIVEGFCTSCLSLRLFKMKGKILEVHIV